MHELAITQSVIDMVSERITEGRVIAVRLEIGRCSGVFSDAVRFCFDLVTEGTIAEGARLDIEEPPGQARCRDCGGDFEPEAGIPLCPCGSADVALTGGDQLRILSVEVV
ncbi:MAG: hydrogenase maturation nickel metallochaperone HypA [Streptosporangiales bacterium]